MKKGTILIRLDPGENQVESQIMAETKVACIAEKNNLKYEY